MPTQTSYSLAASAAYAGMIASMVPPVLVSRIAEEAGGIAFGKVLVKGTGDDDVIIPNANGENNYVGFAVRDPAARMVPGGDVDEFSQDDSVLVMQKGVLWVTAGENVTAGEGVFFVEATAVLMGGTASTNQTQIANAKWLDTVTSGNLGRIQLL